MPRFALSAICLERPAAARSCGVDEHTRRVCEPLKRGWAEFQNEAASLLDLARRAEQAADALDNESAPLPALLRTAASDLEYASYAAEREEHARAGQRIMRPVLAEMAR